uniref:Uncharacterized protein n=1 Tax=Medicago truncatula TaxID=3880 RepID=I3SUI9_MEDTR|nr:unknown [Medicago truncatula]
MEHSMLEVELVKNMRLSSSPSIIVQSMDLLLPVIWGCFHLVAFSPLVITSATEENLYVS